MKFALENWIPLLAAIGCIAMHLLGHDHGNHQTAPVKTEGHEPHVQRGNLP